jgi:hypothetical protein
LGRARPPESAKSGAPRLHSHESAAGQMTATPADGNLCDLVFEGDSAMTQHKPTGWNTWDYGGFNRFSFLMGGKLQVAVHFAIWDDQVPPPAPDSKQIGALHETFRWDHVTRLGPHGPLGLPAEVEFKVGDTAFKAAATSAGGVLTLRVWPLGETQKRIMFLFDAPVGEALTRTSDTTGSFAGCAVTLEHATWPTSYFVNVAQPYAVAPAGWGATLTVRPPRVKDAPLPADLATVPGTLEHYAATTLAGSGALADAPQAMTQAVTWNTLFDARRRLVSSPVSRDWCYDWRGVLVFCWDTFLVATFVSYESNELSRLNFEAVCAAIDELGFVPNYYMAHGAASLDRSMPPLGSYMLLKNQRTKPDQRWIKTLYPKLRKWNTFWTRCRAGSGTGLLSWGSNREPFYEFKQIEPYNGVPRHTWQSAVYESGLDNSPMFEEVPFNEERNTLELDDVFLSSMYAMDCECLAELAALLGKKSDERAYRAEHARMGKLINDLLWDEANGLYCNRHWDGRLSTRWSPTSFFPMIAGIAPRARAERMVREHLLNEREFWGRWVIPSIARTDPSYPHNDYWRGRIWGPFNFLVCEGLRRYRLDDVAAELAGKSLDLFMTNWRRDGGVYENYNADTGVGGDVWNAARLYHWGGLLAFLGMQELIDVEPLGYLRIGSLQFADSGLRNIHIAGEPYEVQLDRGVRATRNGRPLLECTTRAIVRLPVGQPADAPIEISAPVGGVLKLHTAEARPARLNGQSTLTPTVADGVAQYTW